MQSFSCNTSKVFNTLTTEASSWCTQETSERLDIFINLSGFEHFTESNISVKPPRDGLSESTLFVLAVKDCEYSDFLQKEISMEYEFWFYTPIEKIEYKISSGILCLTFTKTVCDAPKLVKKE